MSVEDMIADGVVARLVPVVERIVRAELAPLREALPSKWLSLREAAERLDVDPRTCVAMWQRGELVARKCGRRIVVDASSLRPGHRGRVARLARAARGGG